MNSPANLRQALSHLGTLPAIPNIAREILSLKITTDEGERALIELIRKDPAILSRIIGLANSPLFGTGRKILTLHDAAALLGIKRVKMVALGFSMMTSLVRKPPGLLDIRGLWQHSLAVGMAMDTLARFMPNGHRPPDDEIYLAGLLHDIGFLVLAHIDPGLSDQFHAILAAEPERPAGEVEAEMLDLSHGELGAELGRHWTLPESIVTVLKYHHAPDDHRASAVQPLVAMVNLAEKLLPAFGIAEPVFGDIADKEWQSLGIDPLKSDEIKARIQEHTGEAGAVT